MAYKSIVTTVENKICLIKMNRQETRNAISDVLEELKERFREIENDNQVKAVILTGEGKAFSAGGNVKNMKGGRDAIDMRIRMKASQELVQLMLNLEKPIIAAVNGAAAGAGVSLALACDLVIAANSAFFIQSFIKIGALPDLGIIHFLTQLVGPLRAKELMLLGEKITSEQALQLGLINEVVSDGSLLDRSYAVAAKLAEGPGIAIGLTKKLVHRSANINLDEILELEAFGQGLCFQSEDLIEGVDAFLEKRSPQFNGR
ncbi:enoyl-CoA hydratase-related protein [Peribacillus frigoritolerans]|uniref:enoyl-CoA hydratase/isomerase family protein n=1 Tax=Peribacillus frigoritolerans TaxID=450367 RepID=UPI0021CE5C1D|nr:enoyl-CoA hydratase-related protein [Peribacillus frigoritolerans]MCU6598965.1 enoyl-CoA hydratase-related protein [Peribacillus frigoritolerans]